LEYRPGPASQRFADALQEDDVKILVFVAARFGHLSAKEISERSHQETAWRETPLKSIISYDHADRLTVRFEEPDTTPRF
jgi:uncharacterized phage-associated protein